MQLSLEPEFRRGHGALYDALAAGRVDDERLFSLLTQVLPPLVDGPEGRAWTAGRDVIGRRVLDRALSGVPAADAARVRDACARWRRVRVAVDATSCPRPDAWCSPGREHVHHGACHCKGSSKTTPGWEYQLAAVTGHLRTAWAAAVDVQRTTRPPAPRRRSPRSGRSAPPARCRARQRGGATVRLRRRLARRRPDRRAGRLPRPCPGPATGGQRLLPGRTVLARQERPAGPPGAGGPLPGTAGPRGGRRGPGQPGPEEAPAPGPGARRGTHPSGHRALRDRPGRGLARRPPPGPRRPRLVRRPGQAPRPARHPCSRHRRAAPRRPRPTPPALALARRTGPPLTRRALARLPHEIRHRARHPHPQGHPRPHRRQGPHPRAGRPLDPCRHRRPRPALPRPPPRRRPAPALGKAPRPGPAAIPGPGPPRVPQHHRDLGTPACVPKPARPGPGRPKGTSTGPAPRHLLPGEANMPRTTNTTLTSQKVKS